MKYIFLLLGIVWLAACQPQVQVDDQTNGSIPFFDEIKQSLQNKSVNTLHIEGQVDENFEFEKDSQGRLIVTEIPNPTQTAYEKALVFCEQNYQRTEVNGDQFCIIDGIICETWQAFIGICPQKNLAHVENQATLKCITDGHQIIIRIDEQNNEYAMCVFDTGVECSEFDYYANLCNPEGRLPPKGQPPQQ